jgi:hypothetical protein
MIIIGFKNDPPFPRLLTFYEQFVQVEREKGTIVPFVDYAF